MNFPIGFRFIDVSRVWSIFPKPNLDKGEADSEAINSARDLNLLSTSRYRLFERVKYKKLLKEINRIPKIRTYHRVSLNRRLLRCIYPLFMM
jgi:hypothetical protein